MNRLWLEDRRSRAPFPPPRAWAPVALALLVLLSPRVVLAGTLGIYADTSAVSNCITRMAVVDLHVVYTGDPPIQAIQFTVPTPACNAIIGRFDVPVATTIGTSEAGVSVSLGGCHTAPVYVLTVRVLPSQVFEYCCAWLPEAVTAVDCNGDPVPFTSVLPGHLTDEPCAAVAPHSPAPADGAMGVPLAVPLDWESQGPAACGLGDAWIHILRFGTDPDALTEYFDVGPQFPLSGLTPLTQYYWQALGTTYNGAGPYPGPLWTFTTEGPVSAEQTTWGRIKSLFR